MDRPCSTRGAGFPRRISVGTVLAQGWPMLTRPPIAALLLGSLFVGCGGLQAGDLPPVRDVEVTGGVSLATIKSRVTAWIQHVEAALHRAPIVYTDHEFWNALGADASFGTYPLWIADRDATCPSMASP